MQLEDESAKLATTLNAQQLAYFRALVSVYCAQRLQQQDAVCVWRADVNVVDTGDGGDRV